MAIVFSERIKRQRNLLVIFIILASIAVFIIFILPNFLVTEEPLEEIIPSRMRRIEIDFEVFNNPFLNQLELIEKIGPIEIDIGRDNPFVPY